MSHTISINVDVRDAKVLRRAAYAEAAKNGCSARDYAVMRRQHAGGPVSCDLIMMFDPGLSPDGCSIQESSAEEDPRL